MEEKAVGGGRQENRALDFFSSSKTAIIPERQQLINRLPNSHVITGYPKGFAWLRTASQLTRGGDTASGVVIEAPLSEARPEPQSQVELSFLFINTRSDLIMADFPFKISDLPRLGHQQRAGMVLPWSTFVGLNRCDFHLQIPDVDPKARLVVGPETNSFDEKVVSWFLANGADPDALCGMDITPLSYAVELAPFQIIVMLLDASKSPARNGQLLHHAALRTLDDCGEVCRLILGRCEFGINDIMYKKHAISYETRKIVGLGTALHEAARGGRHESVRVLLEHGADPAVLNVSSGTEREE